MRWAIFILAALLGVAPLQATFNRDTQIDVIGLIETGGRRMVGSHWETGIYQLTPAVQRVVGGDDRQAALRWLDIICVRLRERGIEVNSFNTALAFNAGINAVVRETAPVVSYQYATRVSALYSVMLPRYGVTPSRFVLTLAPQHRFLIP